MNVSPGRASLAQSKPEDFKKSSCAAKEYEAYVQCVCDLSEEISKKQDEKGAFKAANCADVKKAYGVAGGVLDLNDTCKQLLDAYKDGLKAAKPLYDAQGIRIPSSCQ